MPDHEGASCLLAAAERDLKAISNMLDAEKFPDEIYGLLAQQSVEKALKAWLTFCDREVPRTHNLRLLLVLLTQAGETVAKEWRLIDLTAFAVQFRYEAYEFADARLDRQAILEQVDELFQRVKNILGNTAAATLCPDQNSNTAPQSTA
ncbi:MAG: HEPN domain-containing protein [Magnetococcus sp. DMHC-8]